MVLTLETLFVWRLGTLETVPLLPHVLSLVEGLSLIGLIY